MANTTDYNTIKIDVIHGNILLVEYIFNEIYTKICLIGLTPGVNPINFFRHKLHQN